MPKNPKKYISVEDYPMKNHAQFLLNQIYSFWEDNFPNLVNQRLFFNSHEHLPKAYVTLADFDSCYIS